MSSHWPRQGKAAATTGACSAPALPARQFARGPVIDQMHERMEGAVVRQLSANMNDGTTLQALLERSCNERPGAGVNEVQHFIYENPGRLVDQRTNKRQS